MEQSRKSAFTLLELSIVIVIIGLIVAGISAGQSLVHQAKLREVTTDVQKYRIAYNSFKLQYDGVAGDITNASSYWPVGTAPNIADGNGNDLITGSVMTSSENLQLFYQLMFAGLIDGDYEGVAVPYPQRGISQPLSNYHPRAMFWVYGGSLWGHYASGNSLVLSYEWNTNPSTPIVAVRDAQAIDAKNDDGLPYTGNILSYSNTNGQCASVRPASLSPPASTKYNQTYLIANETDTCNMQFAFSDYAFK